jgi:hypothetical protein
VADPSPTDFIACLRVHNQGQSSKENHFHPQIPDIILETAIDGFNILKPAVTSSQFYTPEAPTLDCISVRFSMQSITSRIRTASFVNRNIWNRKSTGRKRCESCKQVLAREDRDEMTF